MSPEAGLPPLPSNNDSNTLSVPRPHPKMQARLLTPSDSEDTKDRAEHPHSCPH